MQLLHVSRACAFTAPVGALGARTSRAQIDDSVRRVDEPRVRVPLISGRGEPAVGSRKGDNGGDSLGAGYRLPVALLVAFRRFALAEIAGEVEGGEGGVEAPALAVPRQPLAPLSDETAVGLQTL